jgi:hypothetical protein
MNKPLAHKWHFKRYAEVTRSQSEKVRREISRGKCPKGKEEDEIKNGNESVEDIKLNTSRTTKQSRTLGNADETR